MYMSKQLPNLEQEIKIAICTTIVVDLPSPKNISSNQLFFEFFRKKIAFTKFLSKNCERLPNSVKNEKFCIS